MCLFILNNTVPIRHLHHLTSMHIQKQDGAIYEYLLQQSHVGS